MDKSKEFNVYKDIQNRTNGEIYLGIVGPVRTGKSTFIRRFMELMVLPNTKDPFLKERIQDELPQSGTGKTIMTTEPKFIPAGGVQLEIAPGIDCKVRMVDCVGYLVEGALGAMEDSIPRMISTPWSEEPMPFEQAAEMGTRKVITDHATMGIVVTTDGSIGTIGRDSCYPAEQRVVRELKALGKPFIIVLNTTIPDNPSTIDLAHEMEAEYGVPVIVADCDKMSQEQLRTLMEIALMEFPAAQVNFFFPGFIQGLDNNHWIKRTLIDQVRQWGTEISGMRDVRQKAGILADGEIVKKANVTSMDLGTGTIQIHLDCARELFYQVLEEIMECGISSDRQFFEMIREYSKAKKAYDKLKSALDQVESSGYGIVQPELSEMILDKPEVYKQGSKYGVRIKAKSPSLHIIKTDITTEVSPIVGSEHQSQDLADSLMVQFERDPSQIWQTNIFGKTVYDMVSEQMESKINNVPEQIRGKVQKSLQKISDEGKDYFICIII